MVKRRTTMWGGKQNERRVEQSASRGEKTESGTWAELEPHLKLDLGFFFKGLMVVPTIFFSVIMAYIGTHNLFFHYKGLHLHPHFCFEPLNNLHLKPKSFSYPYPGMDLISTLDIIFSKNIYSIWILYDQISLFWFPKIRISLRISKFDIQKISKVISWMISGQDIWIFKTFAQHWSWPRQNQWLIQIQNRL
jgi:hypothetical protein